MNPASFKIWVNPIEIAKEDNVQGAYDLVLNDYGPDTYIGSVHIEVPDTLSVSDIDKLSRKITKNIHNKYGVILHTIGVYSVNTKDKDIIEAKKEITKIIYYQALFNFSSRSPSEVYKI